MTVNHSLDRSISFILNTMRERMKEIEAPGWAAEFVYLTVQNMRSPEEGLESVTGVFERERGHYLKLDLCGQPPMEFMVWPLSNEKAEALIQMSGMLRSIQAIASLHGEIEKRLVATNPATFMGMGYAI